MPARAETVESQSAQIKAFPASADEISEIDCWLEECGARWAIPERTLFRARVCIAELAANVIEHGGTSPDRDQIIITLRNLAPAVEVEITDTGNPFDPIRPPKAAGTGPVESTSEGGRGLQLLHSYASAMRYRRECSRNVLVFRVAAP